ncbi:hypothetical protein SNR37_002370 [Agarivorans aestuarii]|uniref:Uncharacterized protein n=1 Tax=Agarivorans aestuarii TaxID=1563703 RepID=A0ABU7G0R7_9ALTE|nr:hypothetical protein [Agarivorans aestuarii]MEE1672959.1 hypothetical protein [Agarivorans aestuarii]
MSAYNNALKHWLLIIPILLLQACSTKPELYSCEGALTDLDQLLEREIGTLNAKRIAKHPGLRYDRFVYSYIEELGKGSNVSQQDLIAYMSDAAKTGLQLEWQNLNSQQTSEWKQRYPEYSSNTFIESCVAKAKQQYLAETEQSAELLSSLLPDDDYSDTAKFFGIYPISSKVFASAVKKEQQSLTEHWQQASLEAHSGFNPNQAILYTPEPQKHLTPPLSLEHLSLDHLGRLSNERQGQHLLDKFAPQWLIENAHQDNLPGRPVWQGEQLQVDTNKATSFSLISYGRYKQQTIIQLNYVMWFKQRPELSAVDWVAGQHDAVIFRIHLTPQLEILAYDSIHLCGCWYTLMLPNDQAYQAVQDSSQEPVLMYRVDAQSKMRISISADTHHIVGLAPAEEHAELKTIEYQSLAWQQLNVLAKAELTKSVFDKQGYVHDSQRLERWFFWPMGVKQPGSLRRFGDHAISFVGERYFDQAYLLEELGVQ